MPDVPSSPAVAHRSGIRDNRDRGSVGKFLEEKIRFDASLAFVSAYFTIYAWEKLKGPLKEAGSLRFLFGEPRFIGSLDPEKSERQSFRIEDDDLALANRIEQKRIAADCAAWLREKAEIRSIKEAGLLHGKMYHIRNGQEDEAILGSSNFTVRGLGLADSRNNIELNLEVDSRRDLSDLKDWFDQIWNDDTLVTDVKSEVLGYLEKLYVNNAPEFVYYLTLFRIFRDEIEGRRESDENLRQTTLLESAVWQKLFGFQRDGVKGAISKLLKHNGCILADSVGLGKTFEALGVIKYFETRNERVLVLCPKKLRDNWTVFRENSRLNPLLEDRFRYDVLSHTDLSRESGYSGDIRLEDINWEIYDLIVIDESHNFRNNAVGRPRPDGTPRRSRYERLLEDIIQKGPKTKVLLLSATPVNNQISDLRNQFSLIVGGDVTREDHADKAFESSLGIESIRETTRIAQQQFTLWTHRPQEKRSVRELVTTLGSDFFKLLDNLSIARSRSQIKRYYAAEMKALGGFPKRERPQSEYPVIDLQNQFFSFEDLDREITGLKLSLYHPTAKLRDDLPPEIQAGYDRQIGNFTQKGRERILIAMMKVNFLKRLESSIDSFRITLEKTLEKIRRLEDKIKAFKELRESRPDLDMETMDPDDLEAEDLDPDDLRIGGKLKVNLAHIKLDEWLAEIRDDHKQLLYLLDRAKPVSPERDAKLARLREIISLHAANPPKNNDGKPVRKILVFTAFADTAKYLYQHAAGWAHREIGLHTAFVAGGGRYETTLGRPRFSDILTNFAPLAKREKTGSG